MEEKSVEKGGSEEKVSRYLSLLVYVSTFQPQVKLQIKKNRTKVIRRRNSTEKHWKFSCISEYFVVSLDYLSSISLKHK